MCDIPEWLCQTCLLVSMDDPEPLVRRGCVSLPQG